MADTLERSTNSLTLHGETLVHATRTEKGWYLEVGWVEVKLSHEDADKLGRALLFEGDDE